MATPREVAKFKRYWGWASCFKVWGGQACMACRCIKPEGHDGDCICRRCDSRANMQKGVPRPDEEEIPHPRD